MRMVQQFYTNTTGKFDLLVSYLNSDPTRGKLISNIYHHPTMAVLELLRGIGSKIPDLQILVLQNEKARFTLPLFLFSFLSFHFSPVILPFPFFVYSFLILLLLLFSFQRTPCPLSSSNVTTLFLLVSCGAWHKSSRSGCANARRIVVHYRLLFSRNRN